MAEHRWQLERSWHEVEEERAKEQRAKARLEEACEKGWFLVILPEHMEKKKR